MQKRTLNIIEINDFIASLRKKKRPDIFTNYFGQKLEQTDFETITSDDCIAFIKTEPDFFRLYFYATDKSSCADILKSFDCKPLVIDYLTKEPLNDAEDVFIKSGFRQYAKMLRFRNPQIPQLTAHDGLNSSEQNGNTILDILDNFFSNHSSKNIIHFAQEPDAEKVMALLYAGLDKYTCHFPPLDELHDLIKNGQVLVVKENDHISGLILFKLIGKTCNFDQAYSHPENDELINTKLFLEFYRNLNERGVKPMYLWVNEKNKPVRNLHKKFGLKEDGLIDYVFLKK